MSVREGAFKENESKESWAYSKLIKTDTLQELDAIHGKHRFFVKDTFITWKLFLQAHGAKLASLLQIWAAARFCEKQKFGVLNVCLLYLCETDY